MNDPFDFEQEANIKGFKMAECSKFDISLIVKQLFRGKQIILEDGRSYGRLRTFSEGMDLWSRIEISGQTWSDRRFGK
jgi:hypothetical protein